MEKPVVIISQCLTGAVCRWDALQLDDSLYQSLCSSFTLVPFCPELALGLGCPRPTIRLIRKSFKSSNPDNIELVQPKTGKILTMEMDALCERFLLENPADGYILKYKSPSCGITNVKVYMDADSKEVCGFESGRFAAAVKRLFPSAPIIDDFRIAQPKILKIFTEKICCYRAYKGKK